VIIRPDMVAKWTPPTPAELPEVRLRLREYVLSRNYMEFALRIDFGGGAFFPTMQGPPEKTAAVGITGGMLMARREHRRLGEAQLYWVDGDMTSLALAVADIPSGEPVRARRMPAEAGLMLFAQPIGGYDLDLAASLANLGHPRALAPGTMVMPAPVVAVSWSTWTPAHLDLDGSPGVLRWNVRTPDGPVALRRDTEGVWLTFWTTGSSGWDALPPDLQLPDLAGGTTSAGRLAAFEAGSRNTPLRTCDEILLPFDTPLPHPTPDTRRQWAHVVYTAWQLMAQTGNAQLTETDTLTRPRQGRKRDERDGVTAPGGVRLVRVHTRHRPAPDATADDEQASHGRRAPQWNRRWPVRPYRRNTCLNSHLHATGDCEHEEHIVPGHIKGPADKPLIVTDRVNLWDTPPPES